MFSRRHAREEEGRQDRDAGDAVPPRRGPADVEVQQVCCGLGLSMSFGASAARLCFRSPRSVLKFE